MFYNRPKIAHPGAMDPALLVGKLLFRLQVAFLLF